MIEPDESEKQDAEKAVAAAAAAVARDMADDGLDDLPDLVDPDEPTFDSDDETVFVGEALRGKTILLPNGTPLRSFIREFKAEAHLRPHNHKPNCPHSKMSFEENKLIHERFQPLLKKGDQMALDVQKPMTEVARIAWDVFLTEQKSDPKIRTTVRNQFLILAHSRGHWALDITLAPSDGGSLIENWPVWSEKPEEQKSITERFQSPTSEKNVTFPLARFFFLYFKDRPTPTEASLSATFSAFCPILLLPKDSLWLCKCGFE